MKLGHAPTVGLSNAIGNAECHCWRAFQILMHAAEIVEGDMQRHD